MSTEAAALRGVQKHYKEFTLGPLDLTVPAGSIVGLVGENGAGKTTTLRLLCGVSKPDAGQIAIYGEGHGRNYYYATELAVWQDYYAQGMRDTHDRIAPVSDRAHLRTIFPAAAVGVCHRDGTRLLVDRQDRRRPRVIFRPLPGGTDLAQEAPVLAVEAIDLVAAGEGEDVFVGHAKERPRADQARVVGLQLDIFHVAHDFR